MTTQRLASPRPRGASRLLLPLAIVTLAGCSTAESSRTPDPVASSAAPSESATPLPTPEPTPTPAPTPRFTNEPDEDLVGLLPETVAGSALVVAPFDEFALTPGDVGIAYGEIGDRFASLAVAYVEDPRTTLYAMRVDGDPVTTEDLEPHLATAGRYVGIAGLDPDPWEEAVVGGHQVWVRPEDNATAAGTTIYTWSSGDIVFLLIGVDDSVNRALVEALPGEPAETPPPSPSGSGTPAGSPDPSGSAEPTSSAED